MRLFHLPGSRSTRVLWALEELGAPYELELMTGPERRTEAHRERHPLNKVPVLQLDDGTFVFESGAILLQLGDLHQDAGLVPPVGSTARALVYQWSVFAVAELEPAAFAWVRAKRAEEDLDAPLARFAPIAAALRDVLATGPWLLGDTFTVADIPVASILGTAFRRGLLDEQGPLRDYVDRALARPANVRAEAIRPAGEA